MSYQAATDPEDFVESSPPEQVGDSTSTPLTSGQQLLQKLARYSETLSSMCTLLQASRDHWANMEALDQFQIQKNLDIESLLSWDHATVEQWFEVFGADLEVDLQLIGADPFFTAPRTTLRSIHSPRIVFQEFLDSVKVLAESQGNDVAVQIGLSLEKSEAVTTATELLALRPEYLGSAEMLTNTKVVVFYHTRALERRLRLVNLPSWEELGFANADGRTFITLCDATGYLAGIAFEVLGASADLEPDWLSLSKVAWRQFQERSIAVKQLRDEESTWPNAPTVLTPDYLNVVVRTTGLDSIAKQLAHLQTAVSAAYLANSVRSTGDNAWVGRYAGTRPASCYILGLEEPASPPAGLYVGALIRLAKWGFGDASPVRLAFAREYLARELPSSRTVLLSDLEKAASEALEAAKANFLLYLRRTAKQYFTAREKAFNAARSFADSIRKSTNDLTNELTSDLYRTIGVVVGVVLAAKIQPSTSVDVQKWASALYFVYILYVLLNRMRERHDSYHLLTSELESRLTVMSELGETQKKSLRSSIHDAEHHFNWYFNTACIVYTSLGLVALGVFLTLLFGHPA